jgi:endonuclease VIII
MPEGPEIRQAADRLATALVNRPAIEIFFAFDHLQSYREQLEGQMVTAISPQGKAMVIYFDNNWVIYSHNQLYGQWHIRDAYDYPETNRQLRLAIHNHQKSALLYSASDIEVLPEGELDNHPYLSKLGPDLLDESVTLAEVKARFHDPIYRRRQLATLLLDQQFLAGPGNYLRSEILFVARIPPQARPADCTPAQRDALAEAALTLTRRSYQTGGITNDLTQAAQLKQAGQLRQGYRHWVFNRQGLPCFVCQTSIAKTRLGGRRLYYCPTCQEQRQ